MIYFKVLSRVCFCLCLGFALSACQPEIIISLASANESIDAPHFTIRNAKDSKSEAMYSSLKLYDGNDNLIWHVRTEPLSNDFGVEDITYGVAPEHFVTVLAAPALEANQEYALVAQGKGLGTLRFSVNSAGILEAD